MKGVPSAGAGVRFQVRVAPRAAHDRIENWRLDCKGQRELTLRVRAVAEDGKANDAVIALLAQELGVPKNKVSIVRGQSARTKMISISGDAPLLKARLQALGADI